MIRGLRSHMKSYLGTPVEACARLPAVNPWRTDEQFLAEWIGDGLVRCIRGHARLDANRHRSVGRATCGRSLSGRDGDHSMSAEPGQPDDFHDRTLTRAVMPVPKLIGPPSDATPAGAAAARGRPRALPDDFLREASARLGIISLVAAGLWVVAPLLGRLAVQAMQGGNLNGLDLTLSDAIAAASVVASLLLFAFTRTANRDPQRILDIGLAYMVLTALALGVIFHSGPILPTLSVSPQISWIGAVVLMFSAIVPEHEDENTARRLARGLDESDWHALGSCSGPTGTSGRRAMHS